MLTNLPKLSQGEADFANLVATCVGLGPRAQGWVAPAAEVLGKLLNVPCSLVFKRLSIESNPAPTGSILAATWPPQAGDFWVESDTKAIQTAIYKSIGQPRPESLGPTLSDLERGVAMYLLARVFEATKESFQLSASSTLPKGNALCLSLALTIGDQNSFLRVWVSGELVKSLTVLNAVNPERITTLTNERTSGVKIPLRVNLTTVDLTQEELNSLEPGDIIILDGVMIPGLASATLESTPAQKFSGQLGKSESDQYTFTL